MQSNIVEKLENLIPVDKLDEYASQYKDQYNLAEPYSHLVLDDVFDPDLLREIIKEFDVSSDKWKQYHTKYEKKLQMSSDQEFGVVSRIFLHALNSQPFVSFLEELTGINGLIPDVSYAGGGLHSIPQGGKLGVHVDFNVHKDLDIYRRLNVILYLNENWKEEYGGAFEMWDADRTECKNKVFPIFNRMVVFNTTSTSYHGHPEPLQCPEGVTRKSLALYYYTAQNRGDQSKKSHSTIFVDEKGKLDELGRPSVLASLKNKLKKMLRS